MCDVAVVQPSAPSHIRKAQTRLGAADAAVADKHAQYDPMALDEHARFYALVAEVFGAPHGELLKFVKRLASIAKHDDSYGYTHQEVVNYMMSAIGVAIQRGNALTLHKTRFMNRLSGRLLPQAQRDAQARREVNKVASAQAASAVHVRIPASPIGAPPPREEHGAFGADGPAYFSERRDALVSAPRRRRDSFGLVDSDDEDSDYFPDEVQSRAAARRRRARWL
jgi:hypothetical protein